MLALTPKQASARYQRLVLVVDPQSSKVRESIIIDAAGNTNHVSFYRADLAAKLADAHFEVNLENLRREGYRIVK